MRTLRLVISARSGALPALVLATLLPTAAASCSRSPLHDQKGQGVGGAASSSSVSAGGIGGEGGSITFASSPSSSSSSSGQCDPGEFVTTFTVEVPPEGTPATPGAICAVVSPVESNKAARVSLVKFSAALNLAQGAVVVDPAILPLITDVPTISVVDANVPELFGMQVSMVSPTAGGFSFSAAWQAPFFIEPDNVTHFTVKVSFHMKCDPNGMDLRLVEAMTRIHLCLDGDDVIWVSSGDVCNACGIIAEMAPSPIIPDKLGDDLALGRVVSLRLTTLARVGRTVILLAENDAGDGASYTWQASGGEVQELAPDVIAWTPPEGWAPAMIQAAVESDDGAAVASFTWKEAA